MKPLTLSVARLAEGETKTFHAFLIHQELLDDNTFLLLLASEPRGESSQAIGLIAPDPEE